MAWERRGGILVYYRGRRTPEGKVVKQYLGNGEQARAAAEAVAIARSRQEADRRAAQQEQDRLAKPDTLTPELDEAVTLLLEATLLAAGFHRQNHGPWRKRRDGKNERSRSGASPRGDE